MQYMRVMRAGALAAVIGLVPFGAHAETLRQALASAYENNPSLASSLVALRISGERITQAEAGYLPSVNGNAGITHRLGFQNAPASTSTSLGLQLSHNLWNGGATDAGVSAAISGYEASQQTVRSAEQDVLLAAANAYMNVVTSQQIVQIRQANVEFMEAQVQSARDRLQIGEGTRLEVSQAEANVAAARANYQAALNTLQTRQGEYERWIGKKPQGLTGSFDFGGLIPSSLESALAEAESSHPAILAAQAQAAAAQFSAEATKAQTGPALSLSSSLGASANFFDGPGGMGAASGEWTPSASIGLSLNVPIFNPSADPTVKIANLQQIQAEVGAFSARDQVRAATISAWAQLQSADAQIAAAQAALQAGRLALDATIEQRDIGQVTTLDVLNARNNLSTIEEGVINARSGRILAGFSLMAATGRLSADRLQLAVARHNVQQVPAEPARIDSWGNLR